VFDGEQDIDSAQEHGVDVEEVEGEDALCLCGEELGLGRHGAPRRGVEASFDEDVADGAGGDEVAEVEEFAGDSPVAPTGIFLGHPWYQLSDRLGCVSHPGVSGDSICWESWSHGTVIGELSG
jgi:hypothetical protein